MSKTTDKIGIGFCSVGGALVLSCGTWFILTVAPPVMPDAAMRGVALGFLLLFSGCFIGLLGAK